MRFEREERDAREKSENYSESREIELAAFVRTVLATVSLYRTWI